MLELAKLVEYYERLNEELMDYFLTSVSVDTYWFTSHKLPKVWKWKW